MLQGCKTKNGTIHIAQLTLASNGKLVGLPFHMDVLYIVVETSGVHTHRAYR